MRARDAHGHLVAWRRRNGLRARDGSMEPRARVQSGSARTRQHCSRGTSVASAPALLSFETLDSTRAMSIRRPLVLLALVSCGVACHENSSDPVIATTTLTSNLGLAMQFSYGTGSLLLFDIAEAFQGEDLNADGDTTDRIAHVVDLEQRRVVNTGLAPGFPNSSSDPQPIVTLGATLAFAVNEFETGSLDRNGDGDIADRVLALYEPDTGSIVDLGLAVRSAVSSATLVACDVAEVDQGQDLDGDGILSADTTVFVHDRRTGETWNTGSSGAKAVGVDADFVSLAVNEAEVGDRNGDGDALDLVFELYDVSAREFQHAGLALSHIFNPMSWPAAHRGRWAAVVSEEEQGGTDLDGDGDALDHLTFVYDPVQRTARNLGKRIVRPAAGIAPFVLADWVPGVGFATQTAWLYDADADSLVSTGLRGSVRAVDGRLVVLVNEEFQGEDLDRNGFFDSSVPVLYDLDSGRTQNLGIDALAQASERGLLMLSRESVARRDWNGDGDRDDSVLFTWDARRGLVNSRLAPAFVAPLGEDIALLLTDEAVVARDLNGDGDETDRVVQTYDAGSRRVTNLGLAGSFFEGASDKALIAVLEDHQGLDLNGDGDQADQVLHLTEVLFFGRHGE